MESKVLTGIVTYNPDLVRLKENLKAMIKQIKNIYIVDNGSENFFEIKAYINLINSKEGSNIQVFDFKENKGIAAALAQIMLYARESHYEWVLTLDQDSIIQEGLLETYWIVANDDEYQDAGMLTCLIKDRNFKDSKYEDQEEEVKEVDYCITSAAFTNVDKYFMTNGYDIDFFIDCVDFDICYSLRNIGYKIYRVKKIGLYHEVGHGENRRFLWKDIVIYHQKPFRIYYLARNTIWMYRKQKRLFGFITTVKKELALGTRVIVYEDNKKEKIGAYLNGVKDGFKNQEIEN